MMGRPGAAAPADDGFSGGMRNVIVSLVSQSGMRIGIGGHEVSSQVGVLQGGGDFGQQPLVPSSSIPPHMAASNGAGDPLPPPHTHAQRHHQNAPFLYQPLPRPSVPVQQDILALLFLN